MSASTSADQSARAKALFAEPMQRSSEQREACIVRACGGDAAVLAAVRPLVQAIDAAEGFRHLGFKNDHEQIAAEKIVYDALYAYCRHAVAKGKPDGMFR